MALLERVVVPVADEEDVISTTAALSPYLGGIQHIIVVHVIEKGGGAVDKAPMEKRRADASAFLSTVESRLDDEVTVETRIEFGTGIAETIVETALDASATAIAFRPRGGSRLVRFLSGDTAARLVADPELPVVSLHTASRDVASPTGQTRENDSEVSG
jgi:nucleotide-binding universal stress UspA family protein